MNNKQVLHSNVADQLFIYDKGLINESIKNFNSTGKFIVKGCIQRADSPNQNKRIYPLEILKKQVEEYNQKFVATRQALGELDHPDRDTVELKTTSHIITEIYWKGKDVWATIEVLDNLPCGKILRGLFERGINVGISSRGLGSVKELNEGVVEVDDDFEIICWDFVSNPSTHGAYMKELKEGLREGKKYSNKNTIKEISTSYNKLDTLIFDIITTLK